MQKKYYVSPAKVIQEQAYNTLKDELQMQNSNLLKERENILGITQGSRKTPNPSQYSIIEQSGFITDNGKQQYDHEYGLNKNNKRVSNICKKIYEVIDLCGEDRELKQIVQAQKQILDFLVLQYQRKQQRKKRQEKLLRRAKSQSKIRKSTLRQKISQKGYNKVIGDDLMVMIEQIQRKAIIEIQGLRRDKIQLMKKLNEEIKLSNNQKKKSLILQNKLGQLKNSKFTTSIPKLQSKLQYNHQNPIQEESQQNMQESGQQKSKEQAFYSNAGKINSKNKKQNQNLNPGPSSSQLQNNFHSYQNAKISIARPSNKNQARISKNNQKPFHLEGVPFIETQHNQYKQNSYNFVSRDNLRYSSPKIIPVKSQFEIQNQINKLRIQNSQMRSKISQYNDPSNTPFKNQLRNQIKQLQARARYYQQAIANKRTSLIGPGPYMNPQFQNIVSEAHFLQNQGRKLIKARSNPHFGRNYHLNSDRQLPNSKIRLDYLPPPKLHSNNRLLTQFSYEQTQNNRLNQDLYNTQYDKLLQDMKNAASS